MKEYYNYVIKNVP